MGRPQQHLRSGCGDVHGRPLCSSAPPAPRPPGAARGGVQSAWRRRTAHRGPVLDRRCKGGAAAASGGSGVVCGRSGSLGGVGIRVAWGLRRGPGRRWSVWGGLGGLAPRVPMSSRKQGLWSSCPQAPHNRPHFAPSGPSCPARHSPHVAASVRAPNVARGARPDPKASITRSLLLHATAISIDCLRKAKVVALFFRGALPVALLLGVWKNGVRLRLRHGAAGIEQHIYRFLRRSRYARSRSRRRRSARSRRSLTDALQVQ